MAAEQGGLRRPTIPDLNRRSGRVPALPYPPPRLREYKPDSTIYKNCLQKRPSQVINTLVLTSTPLAGFAVSTYGRFSGVHRGAGKLHFQITARGLERLRWLRADSKSSMTLEELLAAILRG